MPGKGDEVLLVHRVGLSGLVQLWPRRHDLQHCEPGRSRGSGWVDETQHFQLRQLRARKRSKCVCDNHLLVCLEILLKPQVTVWSIWHVEWPIKVGQGWTECVCFRVVTSNAPGPTTASRKDIDRRRGKSCERCQKGRNAICFNWVGKNFRFLCWNMHGGILLDNDFAEKYFTGEIFGEIS